ncbi:hypothetical protein C8R44DRAFT_789669 [Mycena epipterygia]|nr:hypothetical protein C8R44DRAFT_789669 [Mycena epipterygia]
MDASVLLHRNLEVWLSDRNNNTIPHGEVTMAGNIISTSVHLPTGTEYVVRWRNFPGTAHTVFCEVFIPHKKKKHFRVSTNFMDKDKAETQTRSSQGRLSCPFTPLDWLESPEPAEEGYVALEIRRAQGTPIHVCNPDPDYPGDHVDEIDIDLIDDPAQNCDPFIIFRFNFVQPPLKPTRAKRRATAGKSLSKSTVPQKRKKSVTLVVFTLLVQVELTFV